MIPKDEEIRTALKYAEEYVGNAVIEIAKAYLDIRGFPEQKEYAEHCDMCNSKSSQGADYCVACKVDCIGVDQYNQALEDVRLAKLKGGAEEINKELLEGLRGMINWTEQSAMHHFNYDSEILPKGFEKWKKAIINAESKKGNQ